MSQQKKKEGHRNSLEVRLQRGSKCLLGWSGMCQTLLLQRHVLCSLHQVVVSVKAQWDLIQVMGAKKCEVIHMGPIIERKTGLVLFIHLVRSGQVTQTNLSISKTINIALSLFHLDHLYLYWERKSHLPWGPNEFISRRELE